MKRQAKLFVAPSEGIIALKMNERHRKNRKTSEQRHNLRVQQNAHYHYQSHCYHQKKPQSFTEWIWIQLSRNGFAIEFANHLWVSFWCNKSLQVTVDISTQHRYCNFVTMTFILRVHDHMYNRDLWKSRIQSEVEFQKLTHKLQYYKGRHIFTRAGLH